MRFWVGGYTADAAGAAGAAGVAGAADGIGVLHAGAVDSPLASGDLAFAGVAASAPSPSWIAAHPTLDVLYAAQEFTGTVRAFVRTGEETFAPHGAAVDAGDAVCHVAVAPDGSSLIAACWGDGRVVQYPLGTDGRIGAARVAAAAEDPAAEAGTPAQLAELSALAGMTGFTALGDLPLFGAEAQAAIEEDGADGSDAAPTAPERVSRAHQARFLPGGVLVTTDLGYDLVRFWTAGAAGLRLTQEVTLPRGSGPRHAVWHPSGHLYVVTELSLEVFVLAADPAAPPASRWRIVGGAPLAAGVTPGSDAAAEIALTRDAQYAVAGIRGSNALATLRVRDGGRTLAPVALAEAGVVWPRHHVIERDTVLVVGQRSNDVAALALDERTGAVGRVRRRAEVPSPTMLLAARA
ncbi:MAG: beta-propeller fold lactonase family protein [Microbacterium sp.]|uniref:lactonase family protein n=1 Tax=Microbacterium sp. TaxID=51671 RepID=UPI001AD5C921|nr:beta-propeller fold lactonase family protein [Microbacterium sp.]MBN9176815.1 beta-propeller fold lactonase family protein [Microbacterium sp.]